MFKEYLHVLGFGRAAREVCAIALRRRVCFGHLVSAKYECELEALSFSESKSASGSSYVSNARCRT